MRLPFALEDINQEEFVIRPVTIAGEQCNLIFPRAVGPKWTKENLILRSSVWNSYGDLVSAGYKKFFNYTEAPQITPDPITLNGARAFEKLDGSLLIYSNYKGVDIFRTRGSIDARQMPNGAEIDELVEKYHKFFDVVRNSNGNNNSYLFEWVSPANQIVLFYPRPNIKLIGIVNHIDYSYYSQDVVDAIADAYGLERPEQYKFDTVEELYNSVKQFKGKEGVCVYYNGDQDIKKFKGLDYLAKHSFMSKVSLKETINLFVALNMPTREEMDKYLVTQFDWEIAQYAKPFLDTVYTTYDNYIDTINLIYSAMDSHGWRYKERKEVAQEIMSNPYLKKYSAFAFNLLDGREISNEAVRKFLFTENGLKS